MPSVSQSKLTRPTDAPKRVRARKPLVDESLLDEVTPSVDVVRGTGPAEAAFFDGRLPLGHLEMPLEKLVARSDQPRQFFEDDELQALATTIRERGVLEPLLCRPLYDRGVYEIMAGERRFRAAQIAGLRTVPVIARDATDDDAFLDALIENIHRRDLSALEEARALERLQAKYESQADLARVLGWDRQRLNNKLRILRLDERILAAVDRAPHNFSLRSLLDLHALQESEGPDSALRYLVSGSDTEQRPKATSSRRSAATPKPALRHVVKTTRAGGFRLTLAAATRAELPNAIEQLRALLHKLETAAATDAPLEFDDV